MTKETINFTDFDGNERSEDHYFHLSMSELTEWDLTSNGGFEGLVRKIIDTKDQPEMVKLFKEIILKSYGERIGDAKNFIKLDEEGRPLSRKFMQTVAYDALWMRLINDTEYAVKFINSIVPKEMQESMEKATNEQLERIKEENKIVDMPVTASGDN